MNNSAKYVIWKVIVIWVVFALLHYANDAFPNPLFAFIGEREGFESIFSHSKMNFWTYILVSICEFFIFRRRISNMSQFWYTSMLGAVIYPWFALTFWMTGSALNGGLEPVRAVELSFSFLSNVFGAYLTVRLEQIFRAIEFRKATQWTILLLFLMALVQYISFELNAPWWNYFGSN